MKEIDNALSIEESTNFRGIIMNTAANRYSVMSFDQYKAYCDEFKVLMELNRSDFST